MRDLVIWGSLIALVLSVARRGKAAPQPPPAGYSNLYGKVTDVITNQPVLGVSVALETNQTSTNSSGDYQFLNILPGTYEITFSKAGYQTLVM